MEKLAKVMVHRRYWVLAVMTLLVAVAAFLMPRVHINTDMTQYLPDDSSMKQGLDAMQEEFPDTEITQTIRVMFQGLEEGQKAATLEELQAIPNVDHVDYEAGSQDYNKGDATLYVLHTVYDYGSPQERAIQTALQERYPDGNMTFKNDNSATSDVPLWIIAIAVVLVLVILLAMCGSWIEPLLFLITIGYAVILNMGTNILLGSVSNITYSIAAILQLVLSMDYSIILMNRYRQELQQGDDACSAMSRALAHAFSSILSSAATTIVGLMALVFMSFKIGFDLGVVLAKGIFISLLCIFTVLPGLILACRNLIQRTAKRELTLPMGKMSALCYRFRRGVALGFVVLFVAAFLLQGHTQTAYTLDTKDPIADVFPTANTLVLLYERKDEAQAAQLAEQLQERPAIQGVTSYATTLGRSYRVEELAQELQDGEGGLPIQPGMLQILYYDYFTHGRLPSMTVSDFIQFIQQDVLPNEDFASYLDGVDLSGFEQMGRFADANALTTPQNAQQLADFFGMQSGDVLQLLLYYYTQHGGADPGRLTLPEFARFVRDEVMSDENYASMLDASAGDEMQQLATFTDVRTMTAPHSASQIAKLFGMEEETAQLLYVAYYAQDQSFDPGRLTLQEFVQFLQDDVARNPLFADRLDGDLLAQVQLLGRLTDPAVIQRQMSSDELAALLGVDAALAEQVFALYHGGSGAAGQSMTLPAFTAFLVDEVLTGDAFAGALGEAEAAQITALHGLVSLAASGQALPAAQLSAATGLDTALVESLLAYRASLTGQAVDAMTLPDFLTFVLEDVATAPPFTGMLDEVALSQLRASRALVATAASGQALSADQLAAALGMDPDLVAQVFALRFGQAQQQTLSPEQFVQFVATDLAANPAFAPYLEAGTVGQLAQVQALMQGALSGTAYSSEDMARFLGMESGLTRMLYTDYVAVHGDSSAWRLSPQEAVRFLSQNGDSLAGMLGQGQAAQLKTAGGLIDGAVAGVRYTPRQLAGLLGMQEAEAEQLYLLYQSRRGDTSAWRLSAQQFVDFLLEDVLNHPSLAGNLDAAMVEDLAAAQTVMAAVVSGETYTAEALTQLLGGLTDGLDGHMVELLYLYRASTQDSDEQWTLSLKTLVDYLAQEVTEDPRFSAVLDASARADILAMQEEMTRGAAQLQGSRYGLLTFSTTLTEDSEEMTAFLDDLTARCSQAFTGETYLIGNAAMSYEMAQRFDREMLLITLLTAIAIFLVVALAFRSLVVPAILVLLVQCGVYLTVTVIGLQGYSIYYLALLIVQCILMGATIDYSILFTNYYRENRKRLGIKEALAAAYQGSIHTILTSGLIMILVTGVVGYLFSDPTVGQICQTISMGALCATLLILFVLPGLLAACDRLLTGSWRPRRNDVHLHRG